MGEGWVRNGSGLNIDDFILLFNLRNQSFFVPRDADGLFDITVFSAAKKFDLIIPSLGEIVDYVNLSPARNGNIIKKYIEKNVLITSSSVESYSRSSLRIGYLDEYQRKKSGIPVQARYAYLEKVGNWIYIENKSSFVYEGKNSLEVIFNNDYEKIVSAMNEISGGSKSKIYIPNYFAGERAFSIVMKENELDICKHNICGGKFCFL